MSERSVEIPVRKEIRDLVRKAKGHMTYNEYFARMVNLNLKIWRVDLANKTDIDIFDIFSNENFGSIILCFHIHA